MFQFCYFTHTPLALKYYYVCCRDGVARKNCTESKGKKRAQRESRKINGVCISRMYATYASDGSVRVKYVTSHTNHDLSLEQSKFLPLPKDVKDDIAIKLNMGIPIERILDGKYTLWREGEGRDWEISNREEIHRQADR